MELRDRSLDRWSAAVLAGWGPRLASTANLVGPAMVTWRPVPDLHLLGRAFAADHHMLEETLDCLRLLGDVTNRVVRRRLRQHSSLVAVTTGWADATLERDRSMSQLAPIDMLHLRLRQHFQLAAGLDTDPAAHAVLLVIDAGAAPTIGQLELIGAHVHRVFAGGETVSAADNGLVIALLARSTSLTVDTARLTVLLRAEAGLADRSVRVWIEPLGHSIEFVDAHLLGLTG